MSLCLARACPTFHDGRLVTFLNRDRFGYIASFIMPLLLLLHSGNFYMFSIHYHWWIAWHFQDFLQIIDGFDNCSEGRLNWSCWILILCSVVVVLVWLGQGLWRLSEFRAQMPCLLSYKDHQLNRFSINPASPRLFHRDKKNIPALWE